MADGAHNDKATALRDDDAVVEGEIQDVSGPETASTPRWKRWLRTGAAALVAVLGESFAVVAALALALLWIGSSLTARQQTDLSPMRANISRLIAQGFDGATTDIGSLDLRWYPSRDGVVFTARDVEVFDKAGKTVQRLPLLKAGVSVSDLRSFRDGLQPELRNVELIGGEVTYIERADGTRLAGLGTPETVGRFGPVYRGRVGDADSSPRKRPPILDNFRSISIADSRAYIINENNGLDTVVELKALDAGLDGEAVSIDVEALFPTGAEPTSVVATLRSPDLLNTLSVNGRAADVRLDKVAPPRGRFAALRGVAAPITAEGSVIYSRSGGLRAAEIDLGVGAGRVSLAGQDRALRSFKTKAAFDPDAQIMEIANIALSADRLSFNGAGEMREIGRLYDGNVGTSPLFDLQLKRVSLDATPTFAAPIVLGPSIAKGRLDIDSRTMTFEQLRLAFDNFALDTTATVKTGESGLDLLSLQGRAIGALGAGDVLALWPVEFAGGARRWIDRSIKGGQVDRMSFDVDLDEGFFADPGLTSERLQLDFAVSQGVVRYIETMPLLTDAVATGRVDGNRLDLQLESARIGDVALTRGTVDIPQLMPRGGVINIEADATAPTPSLLALINEPPFGYLDRYGVQADGFGGTGSVTLNVQRPLREFFDRAEIKYAVKGTFENASAPLKFGDFGITDADVNFRGGVDGLFLSGPANLGPWRAQIDWAERYGQNGEPTRYSASGTMDQTVLDGLGIGLRQALGGSIAVRAEATGQGVNVTNANLFVDLAQADIALGEAWSKVAGEPGQVMAEIVRSEDGLSMPGFSVEAPGLALEGSAALETDFRLRGAVLDVLRIEDFIDAGAVLGRTEDGKAFSLDVDGRSLDVSPYVRRALARTGSGPNLPIQLSGRVDTLVLGEEYSVSDTFVTYDHDGAALQGFTLNGARPGGPLSISLQNAEDGQTRAAKVVLPDLSDASRALLGLDATRGGALMIRADMPLPGEAGATIGRAELEDFEVVNAPFLAQILSLASLTGLFDTLSGEGLAFDAMELDFALRDRSLSFRDAKVYGPALGMTGAGEVMLDDRTLDVSGTLVPAYTANSLLGDIPLIGDVFVGGDGEGVFALTYEMAGPFEATQVAVNPLSALTPGFLRGIFKKKREDLPDQVKDDIEAVRPKAEDED